MNLNAAAGNPTGRATYRTGGSPAIRSLTLRNSGRGVEGTRSGANALPSDPRSPAALGVPLAESDPAPGRRWNTWEVAAVAEVETTGIGPLTVGYGDSDGPRFPASAGGCAH